MIIFDELRLSDDAKKIYISIHVNEADYFENIYLDKIVIKTGDKVLEATAPELFSTDDNPTDSIYTKTFEGNIKKADLVLTVNDFLTLKQSDMSKTLFFVYVRCKGTVAANTPCGLDEMTTVGVTFDEKLLYQRVMDYTKSLSDDCIISIGFTDYILLWEAFKAAIKTGHFKPAIKYWNMLFSNSDTITYTTKGCGCHG